MEAAMRKRLFMYWNKPTNNFLGTDGSSSSIEIMENGDIVEKRYGCSNNKPISKDIVAHSEELVSKARQIIERYWEQIQQLPDFVNNGTLDGAWQTFVFLDKKVTVDNLCDPEIERVKKESPEFYQHYHLALSQTELLYSIYKEMKQLLETAGVSLN